VAKTWEKASAGAVSLNEIACVRIVFFIQALLFQTIHARNVSRATMEGILGVSEPVSAYIIKE
jgi:hypothetical protein